MKGYARKNKRMQLNCKYRWPGMAKSNTRKHNKRGKSGKSLEPYAYNSDVMDEYEGPAFAPRKVSPVCKLY